jgi:hypothetical protein
MEIQELAKSQDSFFAASPEERRYHFEFRTQAYLLEPLFNILEKHGVGLIYSHWTWLPPLSKQFSKSGGRFFNSGNQGVIRLMTPLRVSYEESYVRTFPFDKMVDGMMNPQMIDDAGTLIHEGIKQGKTLIVIVNNRAGGNAPMIAREIASKINGRM